MAHGIRPLSDHSRAGLLRRACAEMNEDPTELPFTLFVATAQLIVGIGLIAFASSSAVRIIGVVVIAFALLTGGSAWYHAHRRGQRLLGDLFAAQDGDEDPAPVPSVASADQSSQGPRQPPNPLRSRSASGGPQEPGA